ncbi:MAG: VOC family protein [Ferruginibacter sp.]
MARLNPYLNFNGNSEEAFNFYRSVFGGDFAMIMRFKDSPPEYAGAPSESDKIMHVSFPIGNANILMGSDIPDGMGKVNNGNNVSISIGTDSEDEATKLFNDLSAGGKVTMPIGKTFWGSYFGMLIDKFGINWMVSYDYNRA